MIYDIVMEESYKQGYTKGCEDTKKDLEALKKELEFTRRFIHDHGMEFALASEWEKAGKSGSVSEGRRGHWIKHGTGKDEFVECSECHVCGRIQWAKCPVCETKMGAISDKG